MSAEAESVHVALAAGATDAVELITQFADAPPLAGLDLGYRHDTDMPVLRGMLADDDLAGIVAWFDLLDGGEITVLRAQAPYTHTSVRLAATYGGSELILATQPGQAQLSALWAAVGSQPERGDTARIGVDTVRVAAAPVGEAGDGSASASDVDDAEDASGDLAAALAGDA